MQSRINHLNSDACEQARTIFKSLNHNPELAMKALLSGADHAYGQFNYYLTHAKNRPDFLERELNNTACWLLGAVECVLDRRWVLRMHFEPHTSDRVLTAKENGLVNNSNRLLSFMAQVVTELRADVDNVDAQDLMAEYAECIAALALRLTGPLTGDTFVHPEAAQWHHIHANTQRNLSKLLAQAAKRTQALAKKLEAAAKAKKA